MPKIIINYIYTIVKINWLILIAPFFSILGIAILLFLIALMEFKRRSCTIKPSIFIRQKFVKVSFWAAFGLILSGIVLFQFKLDSSNLIVEKISNTYINTYSQYQLVSYPVNSNDFVLPPSQLIIDDHNNTSPFNHEKMKEDTIVLFWDGFIQTPFITLSPGRYYVEFLAKGSRAEDEYPKLKIQFEIPNENLYLVTHAIRYIELTPRFKPYRLSFEVKQETNGRIQVAYFNDLYVADKRRGRDVWIKEFHISKEFQGLPSIDNSKGE